MKTKQKFKGAILLHERCVKNILSIYNNPMHSGGADWYAKANELANELANEYNTTTLKAAGVIAALSPIKSWDENKRIARIFLASGRGKHTKTMKDKARSIKEYTGDSEREFILKTLNGNKISSFFLNIAYPNERTAVTIDRHAVSVILGVNSTDSDCHNITKAQYEFLSNCYRKAAQIAGVLPSQMQSITWVKWRELKKAEKFSDVPF